MEPLTHLLFGATLSRAGFNRKTALATVTMALAAEAPDLDVLGDFGGRIFGFEHHRGITHTFIGTPFVAALVVGVLYLWHRWRGRRAQLSTCGAPDSDGPAISPEPRWRLLLLFAWIAALSHLLLDYSNNYGIRPFEPFNYRWYSWDIVFVVEPVLWAILLAGLVLPRLFAWINEEVGVRGKPGEPRGRLAATLALLAVVVFWGVRDFEHRRAIAALEALTYDNQPAVRVSAYPYWVNPFRWYAVVETPATFHTMIVDSLHPEVDPPGEAKTIYKPEETPVTLAAKRTWLGQVYLGWAQYPITEVEQLTAPDSGYLVRFYDLRFLYPGRRRALLGAWVQLGPQLNLVAAGFGPREREHVRLSSTQYFMPAPAPPSPVSRDRISRGRAPAD